MLRHGFFFGWLGLGPVLKGLRLVGSEATLPVDGLARQVAQVKLPTSHRIHVLHDGGPVLSLQVILVVKKVVPKEKVQRHVGLVPDHRLLGLVVEFLEDFEDSGAVLLADFEDVVCDGLAAFLGDAVEADHDNLYICL